MRKLIIAIDGPVGSGKSTVARRVAQLLGYIYVDTGAMYRALALKAIRRGISLDASDDLVTLAGDTHIDLRAQNGTQQVLLDGEDVTAAIRSPEVSQAASKVATVAGVRHVLVTEQRRAGHKGGVVMEGRDIGTVVFPDAELKIFLTARRKSAPSAAGASTSKKATRSTLRARSRKFTNATSATASARPRRWFRRATPWWWTAPRWSRKKLRRLIVMLAQRQARGSCLAASRVER